MFSTLHRPFYAFRGPYGLTKHLYLVLHPNFRLEHTFVVSCLYTPGLQNTPLTNCKPVHWTKPLYTTQPCAYSTTAYSFSHHTGDRIPTVPPLAYTVSLLLPLPASSLPCTVSTVSDEKGRNDSSHAGGSSIRGLPSIMALSLWHCQLIPSLPTSTCHYSTPIWNSYYGTPIWYFHNGLST